MTPIEGVEELIKAKALVEELEDKLEAAKARVKELQEVLLPPIFLQARQSKVEVADGLFKGAQASTKPYAFARLAKEGPQRDAMLKWLGEIGEENSLTAELTAKWPKGQIEIARKILSEMQAMPNLGATLRLTEDIHWATLEGIVLRAATGGKVVPFDEIGATFGQKVTITKQPAI